MSAPVNDSDPPWFPMKPGKRYRYDHHDERKGTCCLMVAVEPFTGFRFVRVDSQRTKMEYADFMHLLTDLPRDANVAGIRLVQDHLNTHNASSFSTTFDPDTARRLKRKFDDHYTPTNASWLNMAEIE